VKAGGYAIYGFKAGLPVGRGLTLFTEARNLGDRAFAASTAPTINARGRDPGSFAPGATRSVFAGVEWRLP
jgi:iron complex outermembrane receptor protein